MSQIFYSKVDENLQKELDSRANAGTVSRATDYLAFMTEKIANVELVAYKPKPEGSNRIHGDEFEAPLSRLGGRRVRTGRYLPSGREGYLNSAQNLHTYKSITIEGEGNNLTAVPTEQSAVDNSRRIAPYIKVVDISIGDGSMGLLNKATVSLSVPNPTRDLDQVESIWMRPGRYVRLTVRHPDSATITEGVLSDLVIPEEAKLKELYPSWADRLNDLKKNIKRMNEYTFSGLITSFDLSYETDASVNITLQLTGTSDIYTDVTMFMDPKKKQDNNVKSKYAKTETVVGEDSLRDVSTEDTGSISAQVEIYERLSLLVESQRLLYPPTIINEGEVFNTATVGILPFKMPTSENNTSKLNESADDNFILFGQPFSTNIKRNEFVPKYSEEVREALLVGSIYINPKRASELEQKREELQATADANAITNPTIAINALNQIPTIDAELNSLKEQFQTRKQSEFDEQLKQFEQEEAEVEELTDDNRYITLGALIHFLNNEILTKQGNENGEGVICSDVYIESTYYQYLKSTNPEAVLLLPENPKQSGDMNWYGETGYYANVIEDQEGKQEQLDQLGIYRKWRGVYRNDSETAAKMYPSRIFINLEAIKDIIDQLSNFNARKFSYGAFIDEITALIKSCTANAIEMTLTADKNDPETILYADAEYVKLDEITPYRIPMFANDPRGTIVRDFQFSAKLPSSVKNLSYVLNQGTDISTEKIAPYMNFMFNADDPTKINKLISEYRDKHNEIIQQLQINADAYGLEPQDAETTRNLKSSMIEYLKHPTPDVRNSQQLTAPIFPFDASFTIDGINGFRYGDVLEFPGLPKKYTVNTVFSIIGINHTISNSGEWTTKITCIMRPNIS